MTGTVAADPLGLLVAFGAGIVSFLSPCVLPLVPGYLSMVSGLSAAELEAAGSKRAAPARPLTSRARVPRSAPAAQPAAGAAVSARSARWSGAGAVAVVEAPALAAPSSVEGGFGDAAAGAALEAADVGRARWALFRGIGLFVAGFTVVFVALGAAASGVGSVLGSHKHGLTLVAGALVVAFGVLVLAGSMPASGWARLGPGTSGRLGRILGDVRLDIRPSRLGAWAAPVLGMAFAFAWTPCIGPVLGALLTLAGERSHLAGGVALLFAYSLGLAVPFVATGLAFGRLTAWFARVRSRLWLVHVGGGIVLVAFGAILLAGDLGWLSAQFSTLLNHLGMHRLTSS